MVEQPRPEGRTGPKPKGKSIRMSDSQLRNAVTKAGRRLIWHAADAKVAVKPIVLVGLMGVGKTAVGKRLARVLKAKFIDSDHEIERVSGMSVAEIFEKYGEDYFRERERAVITRLIEGDYGVIAVGGGAFVDPETQAQILDKAIAVWLQAPLSVLVERTSRKDTRPLLRNGDPAKILADLLEKRTPAYSKAQVRATSGLGRLDRTILSLLSRVTRHEFGKPKRKRKPRSQRKAPTKPGNSP